MFVTTREIIDNPIVWIVVMMLSRFGIFWSKPEKEMEKIVLISSVLHRYCEPLFFRWCVFLLDLTIFSLLAIGVKWQLRRRPDAIFYENC